MLLDETLQISPRSLAKVRRVSLLDEAAKPRGILESVCAHVGHGRGSWPVGAAAIPPAIHSSVLPPGTDKARRAQAILL
jgi:hypothetical protein